MRTKKNKKNKEAKLEGEAATTEEHQPSGSEVKEPLLYHLPGEKEEQTTTIDTSSKPANAEDA